MAIRPGAPEDHPDAEPATRTLRIVPWRDPVADPLGVHPCSRYVELYWLGIIGPSTTWLLRRLTYGLEFHGDGFDLHLADTARALGLGDRMGRNGPFRRALARLVTFELARPHGADGLAVRTAVPPLPLRHLTKLPESLQRSHRRWQAEQRLPEGEQVRLRAVRLAGGLAGDGKTRAEIEGRLAEWQFHPAVAFHAARTATQPGGAGAQEQKNVGSPGSRTGGGGTCPGNAGGPTPGSDDGPGIGQPGSPS